MKNSTKLFAAVVLALTLGACASKKKTEDQAVTGSDSVQTEPAPAIESTPMSFDAAGSDSGKIDGLSTIFFDYDKSNLTSKAKQTLADNAQWMKKNPKSNLQIEGHCDSRGSIEYNLSLGERRAQAVKAFMVSQGVSGKRLSVISYGKEKPLVQGETEEAYGKNRRANFVPLAQ